MNEHDLLAAVASSAEALLNQQLICPSPQAQTALGELHVKVKALRDYQLYGNEADSPPSHVRVKTCERCQCPMFFAQEGYRRTRVEKAVVNANTGSTIRSWVEDGRWIPFELDSISCEGVLASWMWVIDFDGPHPIARNEPTMTSGQVWVDHRQTCGTGSGPKHRCPPYLRRYKVNVERANAETYTAAQKATADLLALYDRYGRTHEQSD